MTRDRFEKILTAISTGTAITDARNRFEKICSAIASKIGEGGTGGVDYSTSEVDTGIKWIDGKTIYRKVINGTISEAGDTSITVEGASEITSITTLFIAETGDFIQKIQPTYFKSDDFMYVYVRNNTINVHVENSSFDNYKKYQIVVEYTKAVS